MRVQILPVAAALALGLTGCSGSGAAAGPVVRSPLASQAPSPSPSPAPAASVPPQAQANTRDGASAFATFWIQVLSDAYQSNDVTDLQRYSDAGCEGCNNFIDLLMRSARRGDRLDGGTFRTLTSVAPPFDADGTVIVDLRYQRQPGRLFNAAGEVINTIGRREPVDLQIRLGRRGSGWLVLGVRTAESGGA